MKSFIDMDDNAADFEINNYSKIHRNPGSGKAKINGRWKLGHEDIVKPEKYYTIVMDGEKRAFPVKEGEASEKAPQKRAIPSLDGIWKIKYDFETRLAQISPLYKMGERTKHQPRIRFRTLIQSQNQSPEPKNQSRIRSRHLQKPFRLRRS